MIYGKNYTVSFISQLCEANPSTWSHYQHTRNCDITLVKECRQVTFPMQNRYSPAPKINRHWQLDRVQNNSVQYAVKVTRTGDIIAALQNVTSRQH